MAFTIIGSLIRRPSRLRGTHFQPVPEYPEFSWKAAVLNAVAHRDYSVEGRSPEVTLDKLLRGERRHVSRNPRIARALVDLGSMRDQGEGISGRFAEMAGQCLPEPTITTSPRDFSVTLRNTSTLTAEDRDFVARLGNADVAAEEFRALLEAWPRGRVDNTQMRQIAGLDTLGASGLLRRLRD